MRLALLAGVLVLCACGPSSATFSVYTRADLAPVVSAFFEFVPQSGVEVKATSNPIGALGQGGTFRVAVAQDLGCTECYQLEQKGARRYVVHAGDVLGAQYGLAHLLELFGFRFFHPYATAAPASLAAPDLSAVAGQTFAPQIPLRGLHLHTLHPIEPYFAFWEPSPAHFDDARRTLDWIVKNRGNYAQWVGLDNVQFDATALATWQQHQKSITAYAHARGLKVGFNYELFASANLQKAFDLLTQDNDPNPAATIQSRLAPLNGLGFDTFNISFGEFSTASPDLFLNALNANRQVLDQIAPSTELVATVHLGSAVQVNYQGQTLPYYFLVQYADPRIVPWVHSVMYFDLFEPADGAYGYTDFSVQRAFFESQVQAGRRPAYFPESAYWIAFDNSVPNYFPIYMHSRWLDVQSLATDLASKGQPPLAGHVEFSSGWEWGYWQNDYLSLRNAFALPAQWDAPLAEMYGPWGAQGAAVAKAIGSLGLLQDQAAIAQGLSPYLAGRDFLIDEGARSGVHEGFEDGAPPEDKTAGCQPVQ